MVSMSERGHQRERERDRMKELTRPIPDETIRVN